MKLNGTSIFLLMQIFFVVFGVILFFGLKAVKESRQDKAEIKIMTACHFKEWLGAPVDEQALKATGRPYRILPPGSMAVMDHNPSRLNIHIDHTGRVNDVSCG